MFSTDADVFRYLQSPKAIATGATASKGVAR
jgi:hypothetical protein